MHYYLLFRGLELTRAPLIPLKQLSRKLSHHWRLNLLHNRTNFQTLRPSNLRYFIISFSYCICSSSCFPLPYLAHTRFYWVSPFSLLASYIMSFTFCLICSFTRCIHVSMPCFLHIVAFILFLHSPCFFSSVFGTFLVCISHFFVVPFIFTAVVLLCLSNQVNTRSRLFI